MDTNDYLKNPRLWQASGNPVLTEKKPEELFEPVFAQRYKNLHENLFERITRAHNTLYAIEKLDDFLNQLYGHVEMEFLSLVFDNFIDLLLVWMNELVQEKGTDVHSLFSFKKEIEECKWLC